MSEQEQDGLDEIGAEALRFTLRQERADHRREIEQLGAEFGERLDRLRAKAGEPGQPRPRVINPSDVREVMRRGLPHADEISAGLRDGSLTVSRDAPEGLWLKPQAQERVTMSALLKLPLSAYERVREGVRLGKVELVEDE